MRLDSEDQRKLLLELLEEVPVHTTLKGLRSGIRPEIIGLFKAIEEAPLEATSEADGQDQSTDGL